ncbi:MAG TPA: hypothetical protein VIV60_08560 [Polyangiaceae bacterium]
MLLRCVFVGLLAIAWLVMTALWLRTAGGLGGRAAAWLVVAGASVSLPVVLLTSYVLDSLHWSTVVKANGVPTALLATLGIVSPLEHASLVVVIWPMLRAHRLERLAVAISAGALAAAGFGLVHSMAVAITATSNWALTRVAASLLSRTFCAAMWSGCLATSHGRYRRWFGLVWLLSVCLDGLVRHLHEGYGAAWQVLTIPILLVMLLVAWMVRSRLSGERESLAFVHHSRLGILVDPHGIGTMRAAWQHPHRPALLHWIVGGSFVCFGANIVGLAVGVGIAKLLHIDLSRVNEAEVGAIAPLSLLAVVILLSFALSGYLTAKASAADSVFEPGIAAFISIVALTVLLSLSAPVTIVLALVLAPVAFALACFGAWLGLSPSEH